MSRVGRQIVAVPENVTVKIGTDEIIVKGPKGELRVPLTKHIAVTNSDQGLQVERRGNAKSVRALHGLTNRLLVGAVQGVVEWYVKSLEIQGVGYRAGMQGKNLTLNVGYSHPITIEPPIGIELGVQKNTVTVSGIDKQLVGQVAANIRSVRPPEPYKGKGIRYVGEHVRRKAGKAAKAAGAGA